MTCPNCNSQYNDNLTSCPFCSVQQTPVDSQQAPVTPQQDPFQVPQGTQFTAPVAPAKKKKSGKLISVILIAVVAVCAIIGIIGDNKVETHTFEMVEEEVDGTITQTMALTHKGDTITKIVIEIESEADDDAGLDEDEFREVIEELCEETAELYGDYDFIKYEYAIDGFGVVETITITDASEHMEELSELDLMEEGGNGDFISYEKTKEGLEDEGFELVD